jgi:cyanophycinase
VTGPLAFVGGRPFTDGCTFDAGLLREAGAAEVLVLPTAAAYEDPAGLVEAARAWFDGLGVPATGLDVLTRSDALDPANVAAVREAPFVYLVGDNPMHLRSVLKDAPLWEALVEAWEGGAVLAAVGGASRVLCDPMVDPRGGAFAVGLGLLSGMALIPHHDHWSREKAQRTLELAEPDLPVAAVDDATALIRDRDGTWRVEGVGGVAVFLAAEPTDLTALP